MPALNRLDLGHRGFLLTAAGVAALVVGLQDLASPRLQLAPGRHRHRRRRHSHRGRASPAARAPPLLDLGVLHVRTFRVSALGGSSFRAVITAIPFLLALYFQLGFGWTAAGPGWS